MQISACRCDVAVSKRLLDLGVAPRSMACEPWACSAGCSTRSATSALSLAVGRWRQWEGRVIDAESCPVLDCACVKRIIWPCRSARGHSVWPHALWPGRSDRYLCRRPDLFDDDLGA